MIDLGLDDQEREILSAVSAFLVREAPVDRLNPSPAAVSDRAIFAKLADLGYLGLGLSEAMGGLDLPLPVEVLVFREFGRHLLSPAILGAVIGARVAAYQGDIETAQAIVAGQVGVGIANPLRAPAAPPAAGAAFHLIEAEDVDFVLCWGAFGAALIPTSAFQSIRSVQGLDTTLSLARAELSTWPAGFPPPDGRGDASGRADLLCAASLVGMAEASRDSAVDYVKTREQFGQPIGAFQSVKHRCADMTVRATSAWAQTLYAGLEAQGMGRLSPFQSHSAVILAIDAAVRNGAANIQNHGGVGFTGEHHPHLFLKRAHVFDLLLGGLAARRQRLLREPAP